MEISQIRYFLEVAQSQHITHSAERLHIAQPALTKAIHRLEDELGVPLFLAKGRNIVLSEYGRFLQKQLTPLLTELDSVPARLRAMARTENQTVHLNVLAASQLVTDAIIAYNRAQEGEPLSFQLTQNAESRLYDICVTTSLFHPEPPDHEGEEFAVTERIFLAVPATHRLARNHSVRLIDAAEEGFISLMGSRQFRWICDRFCRQTGFTPNIIFESDSPATVKNMIAARMGIGFWPEYTWGRLDSDQVRLLPITEPLCQRDILFDYRANKVDNTAVSGFFAFLKRFCQENLGGMSRPGGITPDKSVSALRSVKGERQT